MTALAELREPRMIDGMPNEKREWLIRKGGYFYRPDYAGYTTRKIEAGRYTKAEADSEAAVEPWRMKSIHESEIPDDPAVFDLAARLARAERALEEAEKVIAPFAAKSKQFDDACDAMRHPRADDQYHPKTDFTHGHLRAARKWMESRHD